MNKPDYLIDIKADDYHAATKRNDLHPGTRDTHRDP